MDKLLHLSYYFETQPDPDFHFTTWTAIVVLVLVGGGFALQFFRRRLKNEVMKKMLKPYSGALIGFGGVLLVLLGFREMGIPLLSMRLWGVAWAVALIAWGITSALSFRKTYRERSLQAREREARDRYLPHKKK